jgi:hypothetical protein
MIKECLYCKKEFSPTNKRGPQPNYCSQYCKIKRFYEIHPSLYKKVLDDAKKRRIIYRLANKKQIEKENQIRKEARLKATAIRRKLNEQKIKEREKCRRHKRYLNDKINPEKWAKVLERGRKYKKLHPEIDRLHCHKRRALKLKNGHEKYTEIQIYKRDKYICGICHTKIDKKLKWPHPQSPCLDHVIPISRGGADMPDNIQAAHFGCNTTKSNKLYFGQNLF